MDMKKSLKILTVALAVSMALAACSKAPKTVTLDFEGSYWDALVDSPQYGGPLTYGTYDEATWTWSGAEGYSWSDGNTMLEFPGFVTSYGSTCFASGGEVISNYVSSEVEGKGYLNQLEVPVAPKSGKNFVVHYGSADPTVVDKIVKSAEYVYNYSMIRFSDGKARTIKSIDVCPTNYLLNSCIYGDGFFGPISGETAISVKVVGMDASGSAKTTSFKLIDGADAEAYKAGTKKYEWVKWDLSVLGDVTAVVFAVYGTSDCYGDYGFNAPAYFAYDNVVVTALSE